MSTYKSTISQLLNPLGFLLGIAVGCGATLFLWPSQVVRNGVSKAQVAEQSREIRDQTQPKSRMRLKTEDRAVLQARANHFVHSRDRLKRDPLYAMEFCGVVAEWAKQDFDGVVRWLKSANLEGQTGIYLSIAILGLAEGEPNRAIDEGLKMVRDDGPHPLHPDMLMHICLQKLPGRMEEVLDLPRRTADTSNIIAEFGPTTDFQKIGDLVLRKYRESGKKAWEPPVFPVNFIAAWTKRDPQAAWNFCIAQKDIELRTMTGDAIEDFAKAYASVAAPADAVNQLQYLMTTDEVEVNRFQISKHFGRSSEAQYGIFKNALESVPPEYRDELGANTLNDSSYSSDLVAITARQRALEIISTPKARLAAANEFIKKHPSLAAEMCNQLRAMGHTEDDIESVRFTP